MKYKGRKLSGPREIVVPILRTEEEGGNIILKVRGVSDFEAFYAICPVPEPPFDLLPGDKKRYHIDSPTHIMAFNKWAQKRMAWTALQSLQGNDIEWETVDLSKPDTWENWQKELQDAGFVDAEIARIIGAVGDVNSLNEQLVQEARTSFLTTQAGQQNGQNSPKDVAKTTSSGTPADSSDSNHLTSPKQPVGTT